jgi:hypothetical protein
MLGTVPQISSTHFGVNYFGENGQSTVEICAQVPAGGKTHKATSQADVNIIGGVVQDNARGGTQNSSTQF